MSARRIPVLLSTAVAILVSALVLGAAAAGSAGPAKGERSVCGTFKSTSIYEKARVFAIRGVDCDVAFKVGKKFDHKEVELPPWVCALSHGAGRALFSCGYGASSGDVRDFPHALVVKAIGK